jgi:isopenicillin-N epimerase
VPLSKGHSLPSVEWLLDPEVTYLNHGGYGGCPRPVFDRYQAWQRELEREPTDFFHRRLPGLLAEVRARLAEFLGARPEDLALARNATSALNSAIHSLALEPGAEVLTTAHEYAALVKAWRAVGATLVVREPEDLVASIAPGPRAVFVSHVTSPTARVLPVTEICAAARAAGVLSIVDGAHAPGHVELDLGNLGADVYAGNCHKWLCAPKGAGFLWARPEHHDWIDPAVVSWGFGESSGLAEKHEWQGTFDPAAWLAVPTALDVWAELDLERCRLLARRGHALLPPVTGVPAPQMWSSRLPPGDPDALWAALRARGIDAPVVEWCGSRLVRVSVAPYNEWEDVERLASELQRLV